MSGGVYRSRSRSPIYRAQSPGKKLPPASQVEDRKYGGRYREIPPYDAKAYYGRVLDQSDPYERERYREWEREYREWYEKYFKNYEGPQGGQIRGRGPGGRDPYSPERFPPHRPRDNSPYGRGRREDYPPHGIPPRNRPLTYQERCAEKYGHLHVNNMAVGRGINKESLKPTKEREPTTSTAVDSKGLKHKKHRKKRKGEEGDMFSHSDSMEESKKDERKGDSMLMNSSRDDATPVRDEPMDSASVPYKSASDKEKKDKTKSKTEKVKRKTESGTQKKEAPAKSTKPAREKDADSGRERVVPTEPAIKRIKEEPPQKTDGSKPHTSEKLMLPRKLAQSRPVKQHQEQKAVKDEPKDKKEPVKDSTKVEKPPAKDGKPKLEKPIKADEKPVSKASEMKGEKRKRKEEKPLVKESEFMPNKSPRVEVAEIANVSPKPKPKVENEKPMQKEKPAIPSLMDIKPEPVRKIKLNREIGKRIVSTERLSSEESGAGKNKLDQKSKVKLRRQGHGTDRSGSTLVDYTR